MGLKVLPLEQWSREESGPPRLRVQTWVLGRGPDGNVHVPLKREMGGLGQRVRMRLGGALAYRFGMQEGRER